MSESASDVESRLGLEAQLDKSISVNIGQLTLDNSFFQTCTKYSKRLPLI